MLMFSWTVHGRAGARRPRRLPCPVDVADRPRSAWRAAPGRSAAIEALIGGVRLLSRLVGASLRRVDARVGVGGDRLSRSKCCTAGPDRRRAGLPVRRRARGEQALPAPGSRSWNCRHERHRDRAGGRGFVGLATISVPFAIAIGLVDHGRAGGGGHRAGLLRAADGRRLAVLQPARDPAVHAGRRADDGRRAVAAVSSTRPACWCGTARAASPW